MSSWVRRKASFANVISMTAVFIALGGTAVAVELARNSVGTQQLKRNAVRSSDIAANAVRSSDIAANAVRSFDIADGAVRAADIAADAVGASEIEDESISASEIATGAVGNDELAPDSVNGSRIADGSIAIEDVGPSLMLTCGTGFTYVSAVCVSNTIIGTTTWANARTACENLTANARLPTFGELDLFRQRTGFELQNNGEWTLNFGDGPNTAIVLFDNGTFVSDPRDVGTHAFRCVTEPVGAPG